MFDDHGIDDFDDCLAVVLRERFQGLEATEQPGAGEYAYVGNDPLIFRDPTGRLFDPVGVGLGALSGAVSAGATAQAYGASEGEVEAATIAGKLIGGALGFFDPSDGAITNSLLGAAFGEWGDYLGQQAKSPNGSIDLGELLGAMLGGGVGNAAAGSIIPGSGGGGLGDLLGGLIPGFGTGGFGFGGSSICKAIFGSCNTPPTRPSPSK